MIDVPPQAGHGGSYGREVGRAVIELQGAQITATTDPAVGGGVQSAHPHGLGKVPDRVVITAKGNGIIWESQDADETNIYVTASVASLNFRAWIV